MFKGDKVPAYEFRKDVFPRELEEVRERIVVRNDGAPPAPRGDGLPNFDALLDPDAQPSNVFNAVIEELRSEQNEARWQADDDVPHKGLVGLAFSGGGIRSSTYNLGIMQALQKMGLFRCVDYLSTVSGGGYIGSCISSTLASIKKPDYTDTLSEPVNEIFDHTQGKPEPNIFRHLRDNASYLAPGGFIEILRIPALLLRGVVINFLVILPCILVAAALTIGLFQTGANLDSTLFELIKHAPIQGFYGMPFVLTKMLLVLLLLLFAFYPPIHMWAQRATLNEKSNWDLRNKFGRFLGRFIAVILVVAFLEFQPIAINYFHQCLDGSFALAWGTLGTGLTLFAEKLLPKVSKLAGRCAFYIIGFVGFAVFWVLYLYLSGIGLRWEGNTTYLWGLSLSQSLALMLGVATLLGIYTWATVDMNFTGIHKFYRDRLSKAYIVGLKQPEDRPFTDTNLATYSVVHTDDVKLSELNTRHGPYHLINALLNLKQTEERYKTGRHGDFFIFSKNYVGGEITGYSDTRDMEQASRHIDLATAMAISGAAAAPNMGKITFKPLIFILAMLNVRLNYWLPNPANLWRKPKEKWLSWAPAGFGRRVGPYFLIKEMFGLNGIEDSYINLSDGGHIENLGAYELIRRQCRLIIIGDGESDRELKFQALAELTRMVQIDMGIKIEMEGLDEIRRGEQHHAIGTINYPGGRIGKLIYLKSSLLGDNNLKATLEKENYITSPYRDDNLMFDENAYIAYYKAHNPDFPHQTTGDQFFDEAQFECYRALGYAVSMDALRAPDRSANDFQK